MYSIVNARALLTPVRFIVFSFFPSTYPIYYNISSPNFS